MRYMVRTQGNGRANRRSELDRMLGGMFNDMPALDGRQPVVDVVENEDEYLLEAELPGLSEEDVDVSVEDTLLTINAKKQPSDEERRYLIRERAGGEFRRSFVLPKDADRSKIEARFKNGVLTLTVKKLPEAKPRQIKIKGE